MFEYLKTAQKVKRTAIQGHSIYRSNKIRFKFTIDIDRFEIEILRKEISEKIVPGSNVQNGFRADLFDQ
jgi:hypothetical protein